MKAQAIAIAEAEVRMAEANPQNGEAVVEEKQAALDQAELSDPLVIPQVKEQIVALLRQRHHLHGNTTDDFSITNPADVLTAREDAVRVLAILLTAVASVSLVVGGISIVNIVLVPVTERTREIGLRMAIGARRRDIRRQFLMEALTLAP
jgi:putative ABC transport system permease protein